MAGVGKNIRNLRVSKKMTQDDLAGKLFVSRQTVSNYETGKSRPDIEMLVKIAEVLETDPNSLIYGIPKAPGRKREIRRLCVVSGILAVLVAVNLGLVSIARELRMKYFISGPAVLIELALKPCMYLLAGWVLMQLIALAFGLAPLRKKYVKWIRRLAIGVTAAYFVILGPYIIGIAAGSVYSYLQMRAGAESMSWGVGAPFEAWNVLAWKLYIFMLTGSGKVLFVIPGVVLRATERERAAGKEETAEISGSSKPQQ